MASYLTNPLKITDATIEKAHDAYVDFLNPNMPEETKEILRFKCLSIPEQKEVKRTYLFLFTLGVNLWLNQR